MKNFTFFLFVFCIYNVAVSANYYVDPVSGNIDNAGDKANPWDTLEQVFRQRKEIAAGDTLWLLNGHHGSPNVRGRLSDFAVITAFEDHQPSCTNITFNGASKWHVKGLTISPQKSDSYRKITLVQINSSASEIIVENCFAYSVLDHSIWTQTDWSQNSCSGVSIDGNNNIIRDCFFCNVKHGILVESDAENNLIDHNIVENFAADGMRGIGSYNTFQYNTVKNCYDVDDNHDDGFQSYSYGPDGVGKTIVRGIVLRGNTIINYTDPNQRFRGALQGIGCFDGMYEDWLIENNVVITDHWHGISLYGAKNCKIINNTVIDPNDNNPGPPWIKITAHKDGRKSTDNIIRNNLTTSLANDADIGEVDHNFSIRFNSYESYFVNVDSFDVSLKEGARAIDRGSEDGAPSIDIIGTPRPQGDGFDLGAFEYIESTGVLNQREQTPSSFQVRAFPNPFNPYSTIAYDLPAAGRVNVSVFNLRGELVSQLLDEFQDAGAHRVRFLGEGLPSGVYFCKIMSNELERTLSIVLNK